mmetsp:Transcript_19922/g.67455  ORF Transcript_19922/g.67455 Transcript_19922/m.67455 type:complete len:264 (-) Transcript_19922:173-964(-)
MGIAASVGLDPDAADARVAEVTHGPLTGDVRQFGNPQFCSEATGACCVPNLVAARVGASLAGRAAAVSMPLQRSPCHCEAHPNPRPTLARASPAGTPTTATVWARASCQYYPGAVAVKCAALDSSKTPSKRFMDMVAAHDCTGRLRLVGLVPGTRYALNVGRRAASFSTPPEAHVAQRCSFLYGSCLGGQGFGRPNSGQWDIFRTMASVEADFFTSTGTPFTPTAPSPPSGTCPGTPASSTRRPRARTCHPRRRALELGISTT